MVIYCPQITASPSPAISLDKIVLPFFFSWSELKRPYSEMGICTCIPLFLERAQRIFRLVLEFQTTFLFAFSFCTQDHILDDDRHEHNAGRGSTMFGCWAAAGGCGCSAAAGACGVSAEPAQSSRPGTSQATSRTQAVYIVLEDPWCSKEKVTSAGFRQATLIASCSGLTMCSKLMILTGFPRLDLSSNLAISSALEQMGKLVSSQESKIMPEPRHKSSR